MKFLLFYLFFLVRVEMKSELRMVIEVFRHGARGPLFNYWNVEQYWPQTTWGELTSVGMREHFVLGGTLRNKYITEMQFLPDTFNMSEMYIFSTDQNRTLMSAESQLFGFYPLGTGPNFPANYPYSRAVPPLPNITFPVSSLGQSVLPENYMPICVNSEENEEDYILRSWDTSTCPGQQQFIDQNYKNPVYLQLMNNFQPFFQELAQIMGIPSTDFDLLEALEIMDSLQVDKYFNVPLPNMTTELWASQTQKQMVNTPFFADIIKKFNAKIENPDTTYKWIMYSGHDLNIMAFLAGFNVTNYQCIYDLYYLGQTDFLNCLPDYPTFASNLIIELYQDTDTNSYYVQIAYQGKYIYLCEKEDIKCSWSEFSSRLQNYLLPNFNTVCKNGPSEEQIQTIEAEFKEQAQKYQMYQKQEQSETIQNSLENETAIPYSLNQDQIKSLRNTSSKNDFTKTSNGGLNFLLIAIALGQLGGIGILALKIMKKRSI